jgi:uncharacterized membrane protein
MPEADQHSYEVSRLLGFSDGVFAFAITLLVLTIPYPTLPASLGAGQFFTQLLLLKDSFISYLLSFFIIGLFWSIHHHYFRFIVKFDPGLFLLNLTLLLVIAFLPFPTYLTRPLWRSIDRRCLLRCDVVADAIALSALVVVCHGAPPVNFPHP